MKKLAQEKLNYYPLYIFLAWMGIWITVVLLSFVGIIMKTTPDGQLVEKFDRVYYYVSRQEEIKSMIVKTGIISGAITILVGYSMMILHLPQNKRSKRK